MQAGEKLATSGKEEVEAGNGWRWGVVRFTWCGPSGAVWVCGCVFLRVGFG